MKRLFGGLPGRDILLVLAIVVLVIQLFLFSSPGQRAVAQGPKFVQDVFITNTESDPVPVEMTDVVTVKLDQTDDTNELELVKREAFQRSINNSPGAADVEFVFFNVSVPDGKRLVIESASVQVTVPAGQNVRANLSANGPPGTILGTQFFDMSSQGTFGGNEVFTANHSMLLWAGPGQNSVSITVRRSSGTGTFLVEAAIVGYLEDL